MIETTAGVVEARFRWPTRLRRGSLTVQSRGEHVSGGGNWGNLVNRDVEALKAEISHYLYSTITQLS